VAADAAGGADAIATASAAVVATGSTGTIGTAIAARGSPASTTPAGTRVWPRLRGQGCARSQATKRAIPSSMGTLGA
jgi:hypothetical protein